jgi:PBP1b-binding outer membrane lipoprotein LpoB
MRYIIYFFLATVLIAGCAEQKAAPPPGQESLSAAGKKLVPKEGEKIIVAVKNLVAKGVEDDAAALLTSQLCTELAKNVNYEVRCADDVRAVMRQRADTMMLGGEADEAQLTKLDEESMIKVDRLIEGQVGRVGDNVVMNLKVIDPKTGSVTSRISLSGDADPASLLKKLPEVVEKVF